MNTPDIETTDTCWQSLSSVGAVAALISALVVLLDIGISIWLEDQP